MGDDSILFSFSTKFALQVLWGGGLQSRYSHCGRETNQSLRRRAIGHIQTHAHIYFKRNEVRLLNFLLLFLIVVQ